MSILPTDDAIARFKANEERVDIFVNDPLSTGYYTTNEQTPRQVKTLPELADGIVESASLRADLVSNTAGKGAALVAFIGPDGNPYTVADLASDATGKGDALLRTKQPYTGAVARTQHDKNADTVNLSDFDGCDPTGTSNSDTAFTAAIAQGGKIKISHGTYKITSGLNIDLSICGLEGEGIVIIDASSVTSGGYAINVFSSQAYGQPSGTKSVQNKIRGIAFLGNINIEGALLGKIGSGYIMSRELAFEDCSFYTFKNGIAYTDNAWRTHFDRCIFEDIQSNFVYFNQPTNAGECCTFRDCSFINGIYSAGLKLNYGQFHFYGCSFPAGGDDGYILAQGAAIVNLHGCNLETQPQCADHVIVKAEGAAKVTIDGSSILVNETGYTVNYFQVDGGASFTLSNCILPLYDSLATEGDSGIRSLVKGSSTKVFLHGNQVYGNGSTDTSKWAVVSKAANLLYNGDAEVNSVAEWAISIGGTGTWTNITTLPKTGSRHYRAISPGVGSYAEAEQKFTVSEVGGRTIIMGGWFKQSTGTGIGYYPAINFYTQNETLISTFAGIAITDAMSAYTWRAQSTVIPAGTSIIGVRLGVLDLGAGGCTVDYDEITVNIL